MSDKRTTDGAGAARRAKAARPDARLDRLVTALAEAKPVLDDLTRARVGARLAATTRKWAVGSAVRAEPGVDPPPPAPAPPAPARRRARPRRRTWYLVLVLVLGLVLGLRLRLGLVAIVLHAVDHR